MNNPREVFVIFIETDFFTSRVTAEKFKTVNSFDYDGNCLIYLLTCNQF